MIRIWDVATGDCRALLQEEHSGPVYSVAWSPTKQLIASGSLDKMVRIWDATTGNLQSSWPGHAARVGFVAWCPDGTRIASFSEDSTI